MFLLVPATLAWAQPASPRPPAIDPATGLPVGAAAPTSFDPATGLPVAPSWIDPKWNDPELVLTNVSYDALPLNEVAKQLREQFKDFFDILPMPHTFGQDWGADIFIQLQMRNVHASEIFNAMNLIFENDRTPVRWELKSGGGRPTVLLRVLPQVVPQSEPPQPPAPETHRMVYFVGNLLGDEKSGGMTMDQLVKTILEIWPADLGNAKDVIQFHNDAQLIVANGTRSQLDFIQQTLQALGRKAQGARPQDNDLKELEELGKVLQQEPYSNILKSIFKDDSK